MDDSCFPATVEELLCELIARPSVSPEGEAGGSAPGEAAVAAYVAGLLRRLGAEVAVTEVFPGRPNVVGRFAAQWADAPVVALVPHLDTVGVAGMTVAPFAAERRDGRIYGRGACDTKGPLAAALWALAEWVRSAEAAEARVTWVFAATMGEEELSVGASALVAAGFRADFAVVLEPTDLKIVRAEKGVLRVWVEAAGRACHGSTPERGDNAIYKLLLFLAACRGELAPDFAARRDPDLGAASLNVGAVAGGGELNIVPDRARAGLDIRTHPSFDNDAALARVQAAAGDGLVVRVHREGPPFALPADHAWVRLLAEHAKGVETAPWFSDANVLNAHGTPAVAFGPGSIAQAHTRDEFIEERALAEGARALGAFIRAVSLD